MTINTFCIATTRAVNRYRDTSLCRNLCGGKPFGSRHWEYPWTIEKSGIAGKKGLRILDVAPDFTFPYADFLESKHKVTFIDLEKRKWSDTISWGAGAADLAERSDYRMMDVRNMAFGDGTFDIIFCISVLEHIVCPTQDPDDPGLSDLFSPEAARPALKEMRRCLKPGGKLLMTVDIYGGPKWKSFFDRWDIFSDITVAGFDTAGLGEFDHELAFRDSETFISLFHGPYITLGFCLTK